ncbi:thioredoxin family protein [Desulforhabdus amnigena]|jgi:thioredoxin 1|uniref:Thiol reductase thioredoxin n=1 Tax=Desulforhabdus amnigena TaxID=40218 RepID=A0A9W6FUF3_9BACT|nr:thioredoxin family protein [Desulforhabdus amnigena]NLJ27538.1 thioredoxin family protein [Deltaproteobacteria bacterium]GLI35059.1 thiol reductase thioredoxin [Desulforhabdus amnigena]
MYQALTDNDFSSTVQITDNGVVIFVKKLCPHCKNMLKMFEKFQKIVPGVSIYTADIEECPESMTALTVERAPTVCVVKSGKITAQKTGLMNPREMAAFYEAA